MKINWYPGHMEKARKELEAKIKIIDFVIELVDARVPFSSKNPLLEEITKNKPKLLIMTKKDLCDLTKIKSWEDYFIAKGYKVLSINTLNFKDFKKIIKIGEELCLAKRKSEIRKGIKKQPLKTMVVGVPNVGKSTFINYFSKRKVASVANKPGHTKSQQWVKADSNIQLLDTPGILWPRFNNEFVARNLAFTNSIKLDILPKQEIYLNAVDFLSRKYLNLYKKYFNNNSTKFDKTLLLLKNKYNFTDKQNVDHIIDKFLNELINGKVGKITFENPEEIKTQPSYVKLEK